MKKTDLAPYEDLARANFHVTFDPDREVWKMRSDIPALNEFIQNKLWSTYGEAQEVLQVFVLRLWFQLMVEGGLAPQGVDFPIREVYEANPHRPLLDIVEDIMNKGGIDVCECT